MANTYNQLTFLYLDNPVEVKDLFSKILGLELVDNLGWIYSWKVNEGTYICAVSTPCGTQEIQSRGSGTIVSLVVEDLDEMYRSIQASGRYPVSEIREFYDTGLRLFSLKGPQGLVLELRQFQDARLGGLYNPPKKGV